MICKRLFFVLLICFSFTTVKGQESFEKGSFLINAGAGFGNYGYYGFFSGLNFPLHASAELGINEYLSVGPQFGLSTYSYNYFSTYNYRYTFLRFGGKAVFHYLPIAKELGIDGIDTEKLDFFVALNASFETSRYTSDNPYSGNITTFSSRIPIGLSAGFRYYMTKNLGAYIESGAGLNAILNFGITLKLK